MAREVYRTRNIGSLEEITSLTSSDLVRVLDTSASVNVEKYATVTNFADSVATRSGINGVFTFITDVRLNSSVLQVKTRVQTFEDGVLTVIGDESDWVNAPL